MNANLAWMGLGLVVCIVLFAWFRHIRENVADLQRLRHENELREEAERAVAAARVATPRTCANCVHFDLPLGQKELARQPTFAAAAAHVPPWRMGRTLKTNDAGETLPMSEQGISPAMLKAEWTDFGACTKRDIIIANFDTCDAFERPLIAVSSLIRPPAGARS